MLPYLEKKSRKNGFAIFTYHEDTIITDSPENEHIRREAELNGLKIIAETEFSIAVDFAPCKCMLVSDDEEALVGLEDHWRRRLNGELDVFRSNPIFWKWCPAPLINPIRWAPCLRSWVSTPKKSSPSATEFAMSP